MSNDVDSNRLVNCNSIVIWNENKFQSILPEMRLIRWWKMCSYLPKYPYRHAMCRSWMVQACFRFARPARISISDLHAIKCWIVCKIQEVCLCVSACVQHIKHSFVYLPVVRCKIQFNRVRWTTEHIKCTSTSPIAVVLMAFVAKCISIKTCCLPVTNERTDWHYKWIWK